ncbi:MAG: hypothetical protein IPH65_05820 [Dehalococcoidia bacterium]|uniref:hypothetical protein n=1 Tax=Candidatus Amarobacter glycogenicus TaxID=3140699 RepID=UPI003134CD09|nr:hypothetical protein [Dehalococcoidia bacterium]
MALPKIRFTRQSSPAKEQTEAALRARAAEATGVKVVDADRKSEGETIADSTVSTDKFETLIEERKKGDEETALADEADEPRTKDPRDGLSGAGTTDIASIFGEAPSTADQLAAAAGVGADKLARAQAATGHGGGTTAGTGGEPGTSSGSGSTSSGGPKGSDGGPTGKWGLGSGRTTDPGSGFGDVAGGGEEAGYGKGMFAQGALSGVAPVGYDEEEGVRAGAGMKELAEKYKGLPSMSPDKMQGGYFADFRQAVDAADELSTQSHASKDGVVTSQKKADGTIIVTNRDNDTTTRLSPDGSSETTQTSTGKVVDRTPAPSQPVDETAPLPPEIQASLDATKAHLRTLKPNPGSGDIDPNDDRSAVEAGGGEPEDLKAKLLVDPPRAESGIGARGGRTPGMPGLPGDVDPTEDTFIPGQQGPEDDPLAGLNDPTLKPRSANEEEDDDDNDDDDDDDEA